MRLPGTTPKTCSYCGLPCYYTCKICHDHGEGDFFVCGPKTKRNCMSRHATGEQPTHGSFSLSSPVKRKMAAARANRKTAGSDSDDSDSDSDDSDTPVGTAGVQSPRLAAKAKKRRKEEKAKARERKREEAQSAANKAEAEAGRLARQAKRSIHKEQP